MDVVEAAIDALKKAAKKGKREKKVQDTIDHVGTCLVLLKSSSYSSQSLKKLSLVLRQPLVPLYIALPEHTLRLSVAIFVAISQEKISASVGEERHSWEVVQTEILSGILDFLEANETPQNKKYIAEIVYSPLCSIFFPSSPSTIQSRTLLRSVVYILLHESAASHGANQQKLRDPNVVGGQRLGVALSQSSDFLALESLLTLFARLLPSAQSNAVSGKAKRSKFIHEVVDSMSHEGVTGADELIQALESVSSNAWEDVAMKIVDILSKNISFPQPFQLDSFRACDTTFPQISSEDRLYVDQKSFFANINQDHACETFQALYSHVQDIELSFGSTVGVTICLSSPPIIGSSPMTPPGIGQPITFVFELQNNDIKRFLSALHSRGLHDRVKQNRKKISKASPCLLYDVSSQRLPPPSTEDKYKTVEQCGSSLRYSERRIVQSHAVVEDLGSDSHVSSDYTRPNEAPTSPGVPLSPNLASAQLANMANKRSADPKPLRPSHSKRQRDAIFGTSDEELSEVPEDDETSHYPCPNIGNRGADNSANTAAINLTTDINDTLTPEDQVAAIPRKKSNAPNVVKWPVILDSDSDSDCDTPEMQKQNARKQPALVTKKPLPVPPALEIDLTEDSDSLGRTKRTDGLSLRPRAPREAASSAKGFSKSPLEDVKDNLHRPSNESSSVKHVDRVISRPNVHVLLPRSEHPIPNAAPYPERTAFALATGNIAVDRQDDPKALATDKRQGTKGVTDPPLAPKSNSTVRGKRVLTADPDHVSDHISDFPGTNIRPTKRPRKQDDHVSMTIDQPVILGPGGATEATPQHENERQIGSLSANDIDRATRSDPTKSHPPTRSKKHSNEESNKSVENVGRNRASAMKRKDGKPNAKIETRKPIIPPPKADIKTRKDMARCVDNAPNETEVTERLLQANEDQQKRVSRKPAKEHDPNVVDAPGRDVDSSTKVAQYRSKVAPWEAPEFTESTKVPTTEKEKIANTGDVENTQVDLDGAMFEDVAIKTEPPNASIHVSTPRNDVTMIDLTLDASPVGLTKRVSKVPDIAEDPPNEYLSVESPVRRPSSTPSPPPKNHRPRHSVTFAVEEVEASPNPAKILRTICTGKIRNIAKPPRVDLKNILPATQRRESIKRRDMNTNSGKINKLYFEGQERQQDANGEIVEVLNEIHEVIIQKVTQNFEGVKNNVRRGRDRILKEAAADFLKMYAESVDHFNELVDLEKEYAACGKNIVNGFDEICRINEEIDKQLTQTIQDLDRNSLSKKFPNSLFSVPLSDLFGNISLR